MIPTYKVPWTRPLSPQEQELSLATLNIGSILFQTVNVNWVNLGDPIYAYKCYSCYAASGDFKRSFQTDPATPDLLKNGPTDKQRDQMGDHALQHTIMYQWARRVK